MGKERNYRKMFPFTADFIDKQMGELCEQENVSRMTLRRRMADLWYKDGIICEETI